MNAKEAQAKFRELVIASCEGRGAELSSRQVEAVVEVFGAALIGVCNEIQKVIDKLSAIEAELGLDCDCNECKAERGERDVDSKFDGGDVGNN